MEGARSGELALRRLPAVLLDLQEDRASGRLLLRRGRVSKSVDLAEGDAVSATSTNRDETLGHFLVGTGVINHEQHREAVAMATEHKIRVGAALVGMGALTPDMLIQQLTNQTRHKLVLALRWPQGAWRFDPVTAATASDGLRLRMIDVVLTGLRDTSGSTPEDLEALRKLDGQEVELTERGRRHVGDLRRVFGDRVIEAIVTSGKLADIERAAGDPRRGRHTVEALLACASAVTKAQAIGLGAAPRRRSVTSAPVPVRPGPAPLAGGNLFDLLFGELGPEAPAAEAPIDGAIPVEIEDADSGAVVGSEVNAAVRSRDEASTARRALLTEYLRLQGADHYGVLMVDATASPVMVAAALTERQSKFARDYFARFDLAADFVKLDEIHAIYDKARHVLLDDARRRLYDRELAGGELAEAPSLDAELTYRKAEDLMSKQRWDAAIPVLEATCRTAPSTPEYLAALGWARWNASSRDGAAADAAREHLNAALMIDPDHAAAHDYKGRISVVLGVDPSEAAFHLERALELDPSRGEALALLEQGMLARGDLRRLERLYKRLLYKVSGQAPAAEVALWIRLATLYGRHLDDPQAAKAALAAAQKLGGASVRLPGLPDLDTAMARDTEQVRVARDRWQQDRSGQAGAELVDAAQASGERDTAFLAASALVALDVADERSVALYQAHRPTEVRRPRAPLDVEHWSQLRHPDDSVEIGALIELLAPAIHRVAPMTLADLEVDAGSLVHDDDLPAPFARLRMELGTLLGVSVAPVYARSELGTQIHVAAGTAPVLLAGDDALTAPERPELAFRLGRAMTFLWPGRAVGASRPGRVLKNVVLAMFREASGADLGTGDPGAAAADAAIAELDEQRRVAARGAVLRLVSKQPALNLSRWSRSLSRTADRVGLLLCGDVPVALAAARDVGADSEELIEFSTSRAHHALRSALGLALT